MDTKPLERFAAEARRELLAAVEAQATAVLATGSVARSERGETVRRLEAEIAKYGREHVVDKVAYIWFNRLIALRFMDARGYTIAGVVSPPRGYVQGQPEILADAKRGYLDPDVVTSTQIADAVIGLLDGSRRSTDAEGEAYALLLTEYCHYWHKAMPFMFEPEGDFTELLVPTGLLTDGAILARVREVLNEEICTDVEVIGWLYQFYISERKDEVFAGFKKNEKAGAEEIPAATQLFTPHWIVRYLVENSLGRLWMLNRPNSRLVGMMDYYTAPVDDETDFLKISGPEELTVIDPACGSGHMLTYAFDLLYAIYEEEGYAPTAIPGLILTHNLHGTEIDPRAGSLAAFALTMKARAKHRTFFSTGVEPKICVLEPISFGPEELNFLVPKNRDRHEEEVFWNQFADADTLGALIEPDTKVLLRVRQRLASAELGEDLFISEVLERAERVIGQAEYLSPRYVAVVANPPYMGSTNMGDVLSAYAEKNYKTTRTDLYSMFMERGRRLTRLGGSWAVITPHGWMFQSSFAEWRKSLLSGSRIATLTQFGRGVFGSDWASAAYVAFSRPTTESSHATYRKLFERSLDVRSRDLLEQLYLDPNYQKFVVRQDTFLRIDGCPIAFSLGQGILDLLADATPLSEYASPKQGLITGDNDRFLRYWWEISDDRIQFEATSGSEITDVRPWAPYLKGGPPRRWAGNELHVVRWARDGYEIRNFFGPNGRQRSRPQNLDSYFRPGLTWSTIAGEFAMRVADPGSIFDAKGSLLAVADQANSARLLGYLNSTLASRIITTLSPTLDFPQGPVGRIPVPDGALSPSDADAMIAECVSIARNDWDSDELSLKFAPKLVDKSAVATLKTLVDSRLTDARSGADRMAQLELALDNHYSGLVGEHGDSAISRPVTLNAMDLLEPNTGQRSSAVVKDLVSYAVGCMFGRYSLDELGLILADQGATIQDYLSRVPSPDFWPDADNVIPFVDDGWFEDDIVERCREFLRTAFGEEHFEVNLRFVEESLGVKTLRDYFITKAGKSKFYDDHVRRYKKRPIYWMFSSPKGSFNALIYMHRYTPSTVSMVLNDYLREYRAKLEVALVYAEQAAAGGASAKDQKEADRLRKVLAELRDYEHDVLYPMATKQITIHLDDGVKTNYPKFYPALKKITGLDAAE